MECFQVWQSSASNEELASHPWQLSEWLSLRLILSVCHVTADFGGMREYGTISGLVRARQYRATR